MKVILGHFNLCYHFNATYYSILYMPSCFLESSLVLSSKFVVRSSLSKLSHFEVYSDEEPGLLRLGVPAEIFS